MKSVGVVIAPHIENALQAATQLIEWLERHSIRPVVSHEGATRAGRADLGAEIDGIVGTDCVVVLGGDGSVLAAAREAGPNGVPILAVELGEFGFLSDVHPECLLKSMDDLLSRQYRLDERLMLCARVSREGQEVWQSRGLNDAVIAKGAISRMLHLHVWVNDQFASDYSADGLIVATPTGSTAYSLSAGGPILHPDVPVLILTPICAHTLFARPLVISAADSIRIQPNWSRQRQDEVMLTVDGQVVVELQPGDEVIIGAAEERARFLRVGETGFYERLRQKLNWGGEW